MSVSACRPVAAMASSAPVAASGSVLPAYRPPSACAMTTDRECATTSCSSRAIRARSAVAASRISWARSSSSSWARSCSAATCCIRARRRLPSDQAATTETPIAPAVGMTDDAMPFPK
jgi:hypothetical protein